MLFFLCKNATLNQTFFLSWSEITFFNILMDAIYLLQTKYSPFLAQSNPLLNKRNDVTIQKDLPVKLPKYDKSN